MHHLFKTRSGIFSLAGLLGFSCHSPEREIQPSVMIILFDDLGWDDLGVHGNTLIETPNIDTFASQSAQFSNFYVNPVCAASRASLLTGRHFLRTGVSHVHGGKDFMALDETTIADVFQQNGFLTAMWGKWHSGDAERYYPWQRGFEEALSLRLYKHRNAEGWMNGIPVSSELWADELIVDHAIGFLERNRKVPFFAFLSLLAPHTPLVAPESVVQKYVDKGLAINFATLYAMIDFADQQLGRLFKAMDEMGITDNTIVIVLSDNGPAVNRAELTGEDRAIRYVNGYRGHKGDIWENGVKSPLFIRWPAKVKPSDIDALTDVTDIFPTLLDIAGIENSPVKPLDGISFKASLLNNFSSGERFLYNYSNKGWPPSLIPYNPDGNYNEYQPVKKERLLPGDQVISVRTLRYKLMLNPGIDGDFNTADSVVLIDMVADPKESNNLAAEKPEQTQILRDSLFKWYNNILEEPNSYAPPVLYLNENETTRLRATWVSDLSDNLLNTVTAVKRWQGNTGWVEYKLVSEQEQDFEIILEYQNPFNAIPVCTISINNQEITGPLSATVAANIGALTLSKGENTIRIFIYPDNDGKNIDELFGITFVPRQ